MKRRDGPSIRDIIFKPQSMWGDKLKDIPETQQIKSSFDTAIVFDVISNPAVYFNIKFKENEKLALDMREAMKDLASGRGVTNAEIIDLIPRNTILAFPQSAGSAGGDTNPTVFLPFFPPHLAFPVKPGESVWIFYEHVGSQKIGYWLFRKSVYRQFDDINYTCMERLATILAQNEIYEGKSEDVEGYGDFLKSSAYSFPASKISPIDNSQIIGDSIAYRREFIGEPVPRYSKKCGDLILQGSNNTLISLGTDNSFLYSEDGKEYYGPPELDPVYATVFGTDEEDKPTLISQENVSINKKEAWNAFKPELAGAIDLVVGREINKLRDRQKEFDSFEVDVNNHFGHDDTLVSNVENTNYEGVPEIIPSNDVIKKNVRGKEFKDLEYYENNKNSTFTGDSHREDPFEGNFYGLNDTSARLLVSMRSSGDLLRKHVNLPRSNSDMEDYYEMNIRGKPGAGMSTIQSSATTIQQYARVSYDLVADSSIIHAGKDIMALSSGAAGLHLGKAGTAKLSSDSNSYIILSTNGDVTIDSFSDKIKLQKEAHEGYIKHSELAPILRDIAGDVAFLNTVIELILKLPPLIPVGEPLQAVRDSIRAGGDGYMPFYYEDDNTGETVEDFIDLPVEAVGGNISGENIVEVLDNIDTKIPSSVIFGV